MEFIHLIPPAPTCSYCSAPAPLVCTYVIQAEKRMCGLPLCRLDAYSPGIGEHRCCEHSAL